MDPEQTQRPQVEVSSATAEDLPSLVDIEEAVSMEKYPNQALGITLEDIAAIGWGKGRVAKYHERFLNNPDAAIWVAKEDGSVIAFCAAIKDRTGHRIWKLYVAGNKQSQGVGSKLLAQAEQWLGNNESIWLGIASYDRSTLSFYIQHGYEPVGLRPGDQTTVHATGKVIHETLLVKRPAQP